jgi:glycosyltransferase involved in cell wall biosynthesis
MTADIQEMPQTKGSRPLRILFIIDSLSLGGAELCLIRLTSQLPRDQFQCRVLTFHNTPDSAPMLDAFKCPVDHWPLSNIWDSAALGSSIRLFRLIQREEIDIVHTFFQTSDLWAGPIAKLAGVKALISSRRDMGFLRRPKHNLAYRLLHRIFDQVQAVSEGVRRWTIATDGIDPERVVTIHNGIDTNLSASAREVAELRQNLQIGPERVVITTVANLRHVKGIDVLVRAAALASQKFPECLFLVAGDDSHPSRRGYVEEIGDLVKSLGIERSFRLIGQSSQIPALLSLSDIFVLPSRTEGLSNALLEGMLFGLPCVATTVGGNPEVVIDNQTGYLVPPDDPGAMADRIQKLLQDPELRQRLGRASRARIEQDFTVAEMTSRVADAYRRALRQRPVLARSSSSTSEASDDAGRRAGTKALIRRSVAFGVNVSGKVARLAGLNALLRHALLRKRFLVLCYHGVLREPVRWSSLQTVNVSEHEFAEQLDFLKERFHLLSASDLVAIVEGRQEMVPGSAVITFDDGYMNNFTVAAPMLRSRGIPAIFNIVTGHIGQESLLWPDDLLLRVMYWPERGIPLPNGQERILPADDKRRAAEGVRIQESCKLLENDQRIAYLERLRSKSCLPDGAHHDELYRFMNWEQVRELSAQGFEIGSHTITHPILSRVGPEQLALELRASKERIEAEINGECRVIAYPNGLLRDADADIWSAAAAANYRVGLTLRRSLASPLRRMAIDRINVPGAQSKATFESRAAGIYVVGQQLTNR